MLEKEELISHFEGVRKRTLKYLGQLPEGVIDWRPDEGKFSIGDIIRHLGSAELMFFHAITQNEWKYDGHGPEKGKTLAEAIHYLEQCHATVLAGLRQLEPEMLKGKVKNVLGYEVSAWRIIMAMTEHEIHHRGQLSAYMQANHIDPPQIFGLKIEQIPKEESRRYGEAEEDARHQ
ncbi:DinB family protein [Brevibacillus borstelensis]|uniref:DinB family protein n=1 Tax=Brevibacillus borstelensis TaxID=45462 RepID=UPI0004F24873|nr:DinB family protein [Brevibacillus borstelensis]KKX54896.1 damage-inducible protein DinB [Brevibacillus borstelensis cifa_chp40]